MVYPNSYLTAELARSRLEKFLIKSEDLYSYLEIDAKGLSFFSDSTHQKRDFFVPWSKKKSSLNQSLKRKTLSGVKIAIDPGHIGGKYARLENRYVNRVTRRLLLKLPT